VTDADATRPPILRARSATWLRALPARGLATAAATIHDQPLGEFLHIAMAPIAGYAGEPTDFTVANGGAGLILIGSDAYPNLIMPSAMRFVFIGPESPQRAETNRPGPASAATGPAKAKNR
jgi:hypothetical protein